MATEEKDVIAVITRGFASIQEQAKDRDAKVTSLSEKMIGVEFKIDQLNKTLTKVEMDLRESQIGRIEMRVDALESGAADHKAKASDNAKWIKGLAASVIVLLLGVLFNFIRIGWK